MKRHVFAIFCILITISTVFAQARLGDFTMRGAASQVMTSEGLVGAHPSLPINSIVRITNPRNSRELEVVIIDRIDPSLHRIIDLSETVFQILGMRPGDQVILTVNAPTNPSTQPARRNDPVIDSQPSLPSNNELSAFQTMQLPVVQIHESHNQPFSAPPVVETANNQITINELATNEQNIRPENMILNEQAATLMPNNESVQSRTPNNSISNTVNETELGSHLSKTTESTEFLAWLMAMTIEARDAREAREAREIREAREARESREAREIREAREAREARETREIREIREAREIRETREPQNFMVQPHPVQQPPAQSSNHIEFSQAAIGGMNGNSLNNNSFMPDIQVESNRLPSHSSQPLNQPLNQPSTQPSTQQVQHNVWLPQPVRPEAIQIIPGLPDRSSGRIHRLQIGAYSEQNDAIRAANYLRSTGFSVEVDHLGSFYRVMAVGIPSADVYSTSIRLGALGFGLIWVRD